MQEVFGDKYMYLTYYVYLVGIKEVIECDMKRRTSCNNTG